MSSYRDYGRLAQRSIRYRPQTPRSLMPFNRRQFVQASATTVVVTTLTGCSNEQSVVIDTSLPVGPYNANSTAESDFSGRKQGLIGNPTVSMRGSGIPGQSVGWLSKI